MHTYQGLEMLVMHTYQGSEMLVFQNIPRTYQIDDAISS